MIDHSSNSRRQINNELAARGVNRRVKNVITEHNPTEELDTLTVDFYCECADGDCHNRVSMTIEQYDRLHKKKDQFVIKRGHKAPAIEETAALNSEFEVVKKYAL